MSESRPSENRLRYETSPYLLQHRDNPVHWWAWGADALAEAKRTGKPILLSVGYAACHWCHVMAHESFEDAATAAVMNDLFVNIKVDREERPDIDAIYMGALHKLGQQGGWPLTMFLDADARPFWGGTYFPPESRWGRPGFSDVLREVARIYREEPERVEHNGEALTRMLADAGSDPDGPPITEPMIADIVSRMVRAVDPVHGGINGAPKFPQWSFFWLLWRGAIRYDNAEARRAVEITLANICQGGIYDHLAGGFARYSTDERWLAPHFEKMLYDNALLIDLLTEVWRETQNPLFKVRVEETVAWLLAEMVAEGGGFAASLDADSEGEEGKFYVWTTAEIGRVLGPDDAAYFAAAYDVAPDGNWEGHTILNRLGELELRSADEEARLAVLRGKLLATRAARVRPGWDDKVLADWNGLAIAALSRAAVVFDRPDWLAAARRAFDFVRSSMTVEGRLLHSWRDGRAKVPATASDYANMTWAGLRLHEATLDPDVLTAAIGWTAVLDRHYWSNTAGGYATTADDTRDVIVRMRTAQDDATPNANAVQLANLVALFLVTGDPGFGATAERLLQSFASDVARNLLSHCGLMAASIDLVNPQLVVVSAGDGESGQHLVTATKAVSIPGAATYLFEKPSTMSLPNGLDGKFGTQPRSVAYVCIGPQCSAPISDAAVLSSELKVARRAPGARQG
ncbi:MAG: thioredoxin domain-containing protein [Hyphomicrobium sp.]